MSIGKRPVTREAIVRVAVELMSDSGLAAVTLRKIGTELGVSAPTLYWHIASKRELLDHVAEYLIRRARTDFADRPAPGQPWWEWLADRASVMYDAMVAVRDAPQVVAGNRPTVDRLSETDDTLGVLVEAGFPAAEAMEMLFVVGGYVGGMALEAQAEAARQETGVDDHELHVALADAERYPNLAAARVVRAELVRTGTGRDPGAATFDYGLDLLIRGIRARHAELLAASPPAGERAALSEPGR